MKKVLSMILVCALIVSLTACTKNKTQNTADSETETATVGGWTKPDSMEVTDEIKDLVAKATEKLLGATYTPVAFLGSQLVSGTNYSILCEVTAVAPGAEPSYVIVHVYADLNGNAEITETFDMVAAE